jgi:hypothetical protein
VLRKDGNGEKGDDHLVSSYNSYNRKKASANSSL